MSYHEHALMRQVCAPMIRAAFASAAVSPRSPATDDLMARAGALALASGTDEWPMLAMALLHVLHDLRKSSAAVSNIMAENGLV